MRTVSANALRLRDLRENRTAGSIALNILLAVFRAVRFDATGIRHQRLQDSLRVVLAIRKP